MLRPSRLLAVWAFVASAVVTTAGLAAERPLRTCDPNEVLPRTPVWLPLLMKSKPVLQKVMRNGNDLRFQMVVGEVIERDDKPTCVRLTTYRHAAEYTYPASSIKLVGAIAALYATQSYPGWELDTAIRISELQRSFDGARFPVSPGGNATMAELLDATLVVSSNIAFNSLYDIAGRQAANEQMWAAGLDSVRLWHRLSQTTAPPAAHAWAPKVEVEIDGEWQVVHDVIGPAPELPAPAVDELMPGRAYIDPNTGERVEAPMDFSQKNGVTMRDLVEMVAALTRPDLLNRTAPFGLTETNREALVTAMTKRPAGADEAETLALEARFKPLSPGVLAAFGGDRSRFRYVNKAGRAYGFHLDAAYIEETSSGRGFFVAVTLWPNANQVLNDNEYEYDVLSYPAMVALGEVLTRELLTKEK